MDVLAEDEEGRFYNLEIQTYSSGASSIGARFNGTRIDGEFSYPGQKWKDMKEIYIIFFCRKDYLKGNEQIYYFDRKHNNMSLNDGTHVIYINGDMEDDTPIGRLIHDFKCRRWQDMYESPLKERVRILKTKETEVKRMCEAVERLINKEKAKERAKANKKLAKANERLKLERDKAKEKEIQIIKNMIAEGINLETIARVNSMSVQNVQMLLM